MKILLVNPYWNFYPGTNKRLGGPPSTIATVAAVFNDVSIYDFMATSRKTQIGNTLRCGKSEKDFLKTINKLQPKSIGFSSTWTVQYDGIKNLVELVKMYFPHIITFVGGHDASVCDRSEDFDFVVTGEIENIVKDIQANIENPSKQLIHGSIVETLDSIPFPKYELLDLNYYIRANRNHHGSQLLGGIPIVTSRGCPYDCNFCTVSLTMGKRWRANSPEYVLEHLRYLKSLGFTKFHFEDDNLILNKNRWLKIMNGMIDKNYQWDTPNGVRLDNLDDEVLNLAHKSGCRELRVSIETSSDEIRNKVVGKNLNITNIEKVAKKCKQLGIIFSSYYVVGIPGETLEDIKNTLRLATKLEDELGVVPRYSIATPFPGTQLLQDCINNNWLSDDYNTRSLAGATHLRGLIQTPEFTPEDINNLYVKWKNRTL